MWQSACWFDDMCHEPPHSLNPYQGNMSSKAQYRVWAHSSRSKREARDKVLVFLAMIYCAFDPLVECLILFFHSKSSVSLYSLSFLPCGIVFLKSQYLVQAYSLGSAREAHDNVSPLLIMIYCTFYPLVEHVSSFFSSKNSDMVFISLFTM